MRKEIIKAVKTGRIYHFQHHAIITLKKGKPSLQKRNGKMNVSCRCVRLFNACKYCGLCGKFSKNWIPLSKNLIIPEKLLSIWTRLV